MLKTHKHLCSQSSRPEADTRSLSAERLQHVSPPQLALPLPVPNTASLGRPSSAAGAVPIEPWARWHRGTLGSYWPMREGR